MAEQTRGGGFRERIYFDAELWHEIEALGHHMKLEPKELVKMLTALGLIQMKNLTMIEQARRAIEGGVQETMEEDFERMTGVSPSAPVVGSKPK